MAPTGSSSLCVRCLSLSLRPVEASLAAQRSAFSTTSPLAREPVKKPAKDFQFSKKLGKTLTIKKKKIVSTSRPPAVGERKALRKRIVLSNTNALEVPGMQNFSPATIKNIEEHQGKMMGLGDAAVDMLRAVEAFKPTQGWNLFRRPATLVRKETVELAQLVQDAQEKKLGLSRVITGERGSGKSVLALQGMAMAHAQGWIVVYLPDARELTNATSSYEPFETAEGTLWMQPHYTARLLSNILNANRNVLSKLQISKQHKLPIPVQANITLSRFIEFGANDPQLAYPIWQALWSELTSPSNVDMEGQRRPPVFVGLDGLEYVMRASAYLDSDMQLVHAHDLALVQDFNKILTGETVLPNGGMVMGAGSGSNRPSAPTFEHCTANILNQSFATWSKALSETISKASTISLADLNLSGMSNLHVSHPAYSAYSNFIYDLRSLELEGSGESSDSSGEFSGPLKARLDEVAATLASAAEKLVPRWDPYVEFDERVQSVMQNMQIQQLYGLSKQEARGIIEYYAQSGMLRSTVTEGLVNEKWSLAGKGIIGELERGSVTLRF